MTGGNEAYEEMKAWVGFTHDDERLLRGFWPVVEPELPRLMDRFYGRILADENAKLVLRHETQVESLKQTLSRWTEELLNGPWDEHYLNRRRRIGTRHVEVGLASQYMFAAMSGIAQDLELLIEDLDDRDRRIAIRAALRKVTDMDLAMMTGTYVRGREDQQLQTLQELIVSHMPVAILVFDVHGRVTASTGAATRLLDRPMAAGTHWKEVLPEALQDAADLEALVIRAIGDAQSQMLPRIDVDLGRGVRSFQITAVPLEREDARVLLHIEDLSEALKLEARMQQSEALARLGSLSASVAHELRNPLAGMSAAIQVLTPSFDDSDRRKAILGKIDEQVGRLNGLVTDLLSFARPGRAQLRTLCLNEIADSVVDLVRPDAPEVEIVLEGKGRALADGNLVHQVLLNLVQNAVNIQEGRGRVQVTVAEARIEVEDAGPGVPDDLRDQIFQPFFTTRTRGTGLGLAICQRAARSMDASLVLADGGELGGARFVLVLQPPPTE